MPANMKAMIAETFFRMAKGKSIDKITVTDLVEQCKISRQTFYYHFKDMMDVLEWAMGETVRRTLDRSLAASSDREAMGILVSMIMENRGIIRRLLNSQHRQQIEGIIVEGLRTYLQKAYQLRAPRHTIAPADQKLLLDFCAYGLAGLMFQVGQQEQVDEKKLTDQLYRMLTGRLFAPFPERVEETKKTDCHIF